jgi:hypothetical protein
MFPLTLAPLEPVTSLGDRLKKLREFTENRGRH